MNGLCVDMCPVAIPRPLGLDRVLQVRPSWSSLPALHRGVIYQQSTCLQAKAVGTATRPPPCPTAPVSEGALGFSLTRL